MKHLFLFLSLIMYVQDSLGQEIAGPVERYPDGPWMVRVYFPDPDVVQTIANWHQPRMVDFETGTLLLDVDSEDVARLLDLGCFLEMDEARTESIWRGSRGYLAQGSGGIPGFPCYLTVDETFALAETWLIDFPDLVDWVDIGDSWEKTQNVNEGDDLLVAVLTNKNTSGPKPKLFIMASVHAREYTPAALALKFGQKLLDDYDHDADATWLLDEHEIHLLLQANPDGRRRAETGLSWRKNTNDDFCSGSNNRGIDLNRNFPFQWGCCGGSSGTPCDITFRGPSAASESEVQAIRDYVRTIFPDQRGEGINDPAPSDATGIFLDIHSFSELVLWPYGFNSTPTPNGLALTTLGRKFAFFNNYYPEKASVSFNTDGTTDDFAYGELGIAAYTFELGTTFAQPCQDFESRILPDNLKALFFAAKVARTPYLTPAGPEVTALSLDRTGVMVGDLVTVTASFDDERFNQVNGVEPVQTVAAAEVYVGQPPWRGGLPLAMTPLDGQFDGVTENGLLEFDTTGMTSGRHTIFVRGQDSTGRWGAISALFLYVFEAKTAGHFIGNLTNHPTQLPLQGTVQAGPFQTDSEDDFGGFDLLVLPDTYDVQAEAPGHAKLTQSNQTVLAAQSVPLQFVLMPQCPEFMDDVEMGINGWTAEGDWAISNESAQSGDFAWSDSPGGNYGNNLNVSLTSPVVDLSGYSGTRVRFRHRFELPDLDDRGFLEYSTNGSTWTTLVIYNGNQPDWLEVDLEVPSFSNAATAQIRFRLQTDFFNFGDGWHVDDVAFEGIGTGCYPQVFLNFLPRWPKQASILDFMPLFPNSP